MELALDAYEQIGWCEHDSYESRREDICKLIRRAILADRRARAKQGRKRG
jgi:hypothetical protein